MKKLLLPIFGGFLLVSSVSLTTGQNVNTAVKIAEKEKVQADAWYQINSKSDLNEKQIKEITIDAQSWDDQAIDRIVNQALQYHDGQLTIDDKKLDATKLPAQVLAHINLALTNLNQAIASGFIDVTISNDNVQLIYPNSTTTFSSKDSDIVYFDSPTITTFSSYMWYSTYGPSHWWKFWEWGGFIHFSEQAVENAKWVKLIATIVNIVVFVSNMPKIIKFLNTLEEAINLGKMGEIVEVVGELDKILGGVVLEKLGEALDIFIILSAVYSLFIAFQSELLGAIAAAVVAVISSAIVVIINKMMDADRGYGVKWQWANFIIPVGFSAE